MSRPPVTSSPFPSTTRTTTNANVWPSCIRASSSCSLPLGGPHVGTKQRNTGRMSRGGIAGSFSNHLFPFVRCGPSPPGLVLSHEIGHYLHLVHTFGPGVSHLDDIRGEKGVRSLIREFIQNSGLPRNRGLEAFDGDLSICV